MSETLSYIESYFENQLLPAERIAFENRITADEGFAQDVAFYLQARQALKQQLLQQKQNQWAKATAEEQRQAAPVVQMNRERPFSAKKILAIAASVLVIISLSLWVMFPKKDSPQLVASQYVEENFTQLSQNMSGGQDSLQQGIAAYNNKDFATAEKFFTAVYAAYPDQTDALQYNGLVSLVTKDYDKAISRFQMLAGHTELYINPGMFYQAVALLLRNKNDDMAKAKKLLETVVAKNLKGSKQAKEWLRKF